MGTSTDAILAYGFNLGGLDKGISFKGFDDGDMPEWAEGDFDEAVHKRLLASVGFDEKWSKENEGFFARKREAERLLRVELVYHCSSEYPMYILSAKAFSANRGYPVTVDFNIPADADKHLQEAAEVLELDLGNRTPRWLLASYWSC